MYEDGMKSVQNENPGDSGIMWIVPKNKIQYEYSLTLAFRFVFLRKNILLAMFKIHKSSKFFL